MESVKKYYTTQAFEFSHFLESGKLSDVTVVCDGKTYNLYKVFLANKSEFFSACFQSNFKEASENRIELQKVQGQVTLSLRVVQLQGAEAVWPTVVEHLYRGSITITTETAAPLAALSRQLMMEEIESWSNEFIGNDITIDNRSIFIGRFS